MFKLYFTYLSIYLSIYLFIYLLLTAVPIISARLD